MFRWFRRSGSSKNPLVTSQPPEVGRLYSEILLPAWAPPNPKLIEELMLRDWQTCANATEEALQKFAMRVELICEPGEVPNARLAGVHTLDWPTAFQDVEKHGSLIRLSVALVEKSPREGVVASTVLGLGVYRVLQSFEPDLVPIAVHWCGSGAIIKPSDFVAAAPKFNEVGGRPCRQWRRWQRRGRSQGQSRSRRALRPLPALPQPLTRRARPMPIWAAPFYLRAFPLVSCRQGR